MVSDQPLIDINQVLSGIRKQIIDSVQYCVDNFSGFPNAEALFNALKNCTTFEHDPPRVELIQTAKTLFEKNYWGVPGKGDCDDFVVLACACFIANGWNKFDIILTGRSKVYPVHIYTQVNDGSGWQIFDLTNSYIGEERIYPMKQVLPIKFHKP